MIRLTERFVLEREIGSGGMSTVYLGRDEVLERPVAVKLLKPEYANTDIGARFRREGRTAARLSHPSVVQVYDAGESEFGGQGTSYIVMEYVSGGDLKGLIDRRGALSGGELTKLSEVAAGLAHAHQRGVIHRDIKPHNILLDENARPKLTDFGVARALDATYATRTGSYLGTVLYSPPEQLLGEKVTPKSDVYSLGVTLYYAATGQPPFTGTPIEIASQHVSRQPPPPRELNDVVSPSLEALILDCMNKDPDARPTADEVRLRLQEDGSTRATDAYREPPVTAPTENARTVAAPEPGSTQEKAGRPERRGGLLAALAVVAVLAVTGALAASTLLGGGSNEHAGGQPPANKGDMNPSNGGKALENQHGGAAQQAAPQAGQDRTGGAPSEVQAAERTVREFYTSSVAGNYDRAAQLLSESFRQSTFPNRATFQGTFAGVERVEFVEGPVARISGDTATVTGRTQATLTDQIQQNQGTWRLVKENGGWKIDGLTVNRLDTQPR